MRNDYSLASIQNIIRANTQLLNDKKDLEKELLDKDKIINKAKEYIRSFDYYIPEDNKENIIKILEGKEDEENEDIFSTL
jgi:hypothetical protein